MARQPRTTTQNPAPQPSPEWVFSKVLDSLHEIVLFLDADNVVQFAAGGVAAMLGCQPPDLVGRPAAELISSPDGIDFHELVQQSRDNIATRIDFRRADDVPLPLGMTASPLTADTQLPYAMVVALRDISGELEMQEALAARNKQLAMLGRVSGLVALGGELTPLMEKLLLIVMQALRLHAAAVLTVARDSNQGRPLAQRGMPRDVAESLCAVRYDIDWLQAVMADQHPRPLIDAPFMTDEIRELLQRHRLDQAMCFLLVSKGRAFGVLLYASLGGIGAQDRALLEAITGQMALAIEKDNLLRTLQESEHKYSTLVESANDGIMISQDGVFKFVNKKLADMLGHTVSDMTGMSIQHIMYPEDEPLLMAGYEKRVSGKVPKEIYQGRLMTSDGTPLQVEMNAATIEFGGQYASLSFVRDLSLRLRLQKELVSEKETAEFYNDLLTHDVSNLLHTISGNLDLMGDPMFGELDETHERYRQKALANAHRCARLIGRVRELMMIRTLDPSQFTPLPLKQMLTEAIEVVREQFAGVRFLVTLDAEPHQHVLGPTVAGQIFVNLASNAVRHNPHENKEVRISVSDSNDQSHWMIAVEDNGAGIDPEEKDRICRRFAKFSTFGGIGLGMSIVKALVDSMRGTMAIEDRVADDQVIGTRFIVALPKA